ncbi:MAG: DUF1080 domain-containing protein [Balneolaceae bacterium]|nr:DUF1080 domain-containing protein [Balneolaceae bacterium]
MTKIKFILLNLPLLFFLISTAFAQQNMEWPHELTEDWTPVDDSVSTTGYFGQAPSDAIMLFDGSDLSNWEAAPGYFINAEQVPEYLEALQTHHGPAPWKVEDGVMTVVPGSGNIMTKMGFTDFHLHIEWKTPEEIDGEGQGRGNSGVFLQGLYEIQVLDSWQNPTYPNGQAGSIYKQTAPMVNASRPPGEWQSYDIFFEAAYFDDTGKLIKPAYVTVIHNGVLIHHKQKIKGPTTFIGPPKYKPHPRKLPIGLQDHGDYVSFRNIWIREL